MKHLIWDLSVLFRNRVPSARNARRRLRRSANVAACLKSAPLDNDELATGIAQRLEPALLEEFQRITTGLRKCTAKIDRKLLWIEGEVANGLEANFKGSLDDLARGVALIASQAHTEFEEAQSNADESSRYIRRFRLEHGITRPVQEPPHWAKVTGILLLVSMCEGICVCFLLKDAVAGGLPQAAVFGIGTGLLTVGLGSVVGHTAGRAINKPDRLSRVIGTVGSLIGLAIMGVLHVELARIREGMLAGRHLLGNPLAVAWGVPLHSETVATVALGVAFGVYAWSTAKRGRFADPTPGYLEAAREEQGARTRLGDVWRAAREQAQGLAADILSEIAARRADLERKKGSINLLLDRQRFIAARAERIAAVLEGAAARIFREALAPVISGPITAPELHVAQNLSAFAPGPEVDRVSDAIHGAINMLGDAKKSIEDTIDEALRPFDPRLVETELAR